MDFSVVAVPIQYCVGTYMVIKIIMFNRILSMTKNIVDLYSNRYEIEIHIVLSFLVDKYTMYIMLDNISSCKFSSTNFSW